MKRSCLASLMGLSLWSEDDDAETATDSTAPVRTAPPGYQEFITGILDVETNAEAYDVYLKTQTRDLTNWLKHDETMLDLATALKDEGDLRRTKKAPAKKGKKRASKNSQG